MSTFQRIVPVKLIAGKEYVLRNGRHVYVKDNPHWQCAAKFPFFVMQGLDFIVYFTPEGQADPAGGENEYDIIRPVYKEGETYIDGDNNRVTITRVDAHTYTYPVHGDDGEEYTLDGKYLDAGSENSKSNLFDYVRKAVDAIKPAPQFGDLLREAVAAPALPILATPVTPSRVGMRVEVQLDCATTVQATIMHEDAAHVAIEFDPDYYHAGAWTCDGHVPSGRGWYVPKDSVRAVGEAETQVEAERSEAEALNEVDVAEVWAAYRINPSISIDDWIVARRVLKAATQ